jgi:hypothetical protein
MASVDAGISFSIRFFEAISKTTMGRKIVTKCSDHPLVGDLAKSLNDVLRSQARPLLLVLGMVLFLASVPTSNAGSMPFLPAQGSTIPSSNSDVNPYGLAQVPVGFPKGTLSAGQLLVSNFNNSVADGNTQGAGSTIVTIDPSTGQQAGLFFQGTPPIGFTNALGIVKAGFVFAGSVTGASSSLGLLVIDSSGNLVSTITT